MLKQLTVFAFVILAFIHKTDAQHIPRLIGYEESSRDSAGALVHYKAYWNNFSGNRGSTVKPFSLAGWTYFDRFVDISAPDTTLEVTRHFGPGAYFDSSMSVFVYDSAKNTRLTESYSWDTLTSSWVYTRITKDSFVFSSGQLVASYHFLYDTVAKSFGDVGNHIYTYNTAGKLISDVSTWRIALSGGWNTNKWEYTWSGNNMTSEKIYELVSGPAWRLSWDRQCTYTGSKPFTLQTDFWNGTISSPYLSSSYQDSNVYSGSTLTNRYSHISGGGSYKFNLRNTYQHDANGNVTEIISELRDTSGTWKNYTKMTISYNGINNPLLITEYTWDASTWKLNLYRPYLKQFHYQGFPASIPEQSGNDMSLYPSPATHGITLKTTFKKDADCIIAIVDMQGRLQRQWTEHIPAGHSEITMQISSLASGNYLLRLSSPGETAVKAFSVVK